MAAGTPRRSGLRVAVVAAALLGVLAVAPVAQAYPWPVWPFDRQHPIRGNFGDPRSLRGYVDIRDDNPLSFHDGVDIQAPDGTPVYAIEAGQVHLTDRTAIAVGSPLAVPDAPVVFGYWHVDPVVGNLQYVAAGQLVGHVHRGAGHVHLSEKRFGRYVNPLRRGGLSPYRDPTHPVIRGLVAYRAGTQTELDPASLSGRVDLAVDAYDPPSIPLWGTWGGSILAPARITWTASFGGGWIPFAADTSTVDFFHWSADRSVRDVYAPGTRQNAAGEPGDYRFWLVRGLDTSLLEGPQVVWVTASDMRGNQTTRALRFAVPPES